MILLGNKAQFRAAGALVLSCVTLGAMASSAFGASSTTVRATPLAIGESLSDGNGGTAIRLGATGTADAVAPDGTGTVHGCSRTYTCGYEGANYGGTYRYAFYPSFDNFQFLEGSCLSLDAGFSFNDCAESVWNNYGSCDGADWYFNEDYGGTSYQNADSSGTTQLSSKYADEFSSVIDCGY